MEGTGHLVDGVLRVLLHVEQHLLSVALGLVPLGHIEARLGLLEPLQLFYVLNHKFLVPQPLPLALQARDGATVRARPHPRRLSRPIPLWIASCGERC